jgi:hypothetical protein
MLQARNRLLSHFGVTACAHTHTRERWVYDVEDYKNRALII